MSVFGGIFGGNKQPDKPIERKRKSNIPGAYDAEVQDDPRRHLYTDAAKKEKESNEPALDVYRNILSASKDILNKASVNSNWLTGAIKTPKDYVLKFTPEAIQKKYGMVGINSSELITADLSDLFQELVALFDDEKAQKELKFGKQSILNMMLVILSVLDIRNQSTLDVVNRNPRAAKILEYYIPEASNDF
jgi:hypothetical protein